MLVLLSHTLGWAVIQTVQIVLPQLRTGACRTYMVGRLRELAKVP